MRGLKSSRKNAVPTSVSDTICYCSDVVETVHWLYPNNSAMANVKLEQWSCFVLAATNAVEHSQFPQIFIIFCCCSSYGLSFMVCYVFHCKDCSPTAMETWVAKQANFSHMCVTVLANLTAEKLKQDGFQKTGEHVYFNLQDTIIPYFDANWENLTSMPRRVKNTWHTTLQKTLIKDTELFKVNPEDENSFALMETNLADIGPVNEFVKQRRVQIGKKSNSGEKNNLASTLVGAQQGMGRSSGADSDVDGGPKTRGASKRRNVDSIGTGKKPKLATDYSSSKIAAADGSGPIDFPFNKEGYRYFLVERDPNVVDRANTEEDDGLTPRIIPPYLYRLHLQRSVSISPNDRAHELRVSDDQLTVTGFEGYRVARATHAVSKGTWYFEVNFLKQPEDSHIRIGWSQPLAVVQSCIGYNKLSYSWRSLKGTKFHDAIGKKYQFGGYKEGDVLGCLIHLPHNPVKPGPSNQWLPSSYKDLPLINFKHNYFYESHDEVADVLKSLEPLQGSRIEFFKNGKPCGVAFTDIYKGFYHPAVSLFKNATVRCNFGPKLQYLPPGAKPMSARYMQNAVRGVTQKMMKVIPVRALEDNYMYLVYSEKDLKGFAVDPVEPQKIKAAAEDHKVTVAAALVTHHHWDHAGGMGEFRKIWPADKAIVYGGDDRIDNLSHKVEHEEKFTVGEMEVTAFKTPCHTKGHVCYYVSHPGDDHRILLTGDTLFIAGCGKFFEGEGYAVSGYHCGVLESWITISEIRGMAESGDVLEDLSIAQGAVLVKSCEVPQDATVIRGYDFNEGIDFSKLMASYLSTGFQATHLGKAIVEVNAMLDAREKEQTDEKRGHFFPYPEKRPIPPCTIFLGYTSNLVSSGLREVRASSRASSASHAKVQQLCEGMLQNSSIS
ncbi:metallo-beta-lactamase domain protein [Ancylostoma caninum]|uniref:Metallo-beta-lactamase domain protein n=1 Tax=Ancylostoma caninum TaxID=29170 RepID=A0A368FLY1_ANCCA|nr:metallo-beta-lactamase domain protein [Ancylostoma caninum]